MAKDETTRSCQHCGAEFKTSQYRVNTGRGVFCSRECKYKALRPSEGKLIENFIAKHNRTPQDLSLYLNENKTTLTQYSKLCSIPVGTLGKQLKRFGVYAYKAPLKVISSFDCNYCGNAFKAYERPSRIKRNVYCGVECQKASKRKAFDDRQFRISRYQFAPPLETLGNYKSLELGSRQRSFVNKDKVDHFFFRQGIHAEGTSYVYGVLLTDGNLYRDKKGTYQVRLQMTDMDIVEQVSMIMQNKNPLYVDRVRQTATLLMTSPYLFHDLCALGCVPNKTAFASYPLVPGDLDCHLIRGIIDGDGSWVIKRDGLLYLQICGNDLLMYGVYRRIFEHLRISPQSAQYPVEFDRRIKMKSFCSVKYNTTDSLKIRDWVYRTASIYGKRKFIKAHSVKAPYTERLTTSRLADLLGVSQDFVKGSVRSGLPHSKRGPYSFFEEEHIPIWIEFLQSRLRDPKCKFPNRKELIKRWQVNKADSARIPELMKSNGGKVHSDS